MAIERINLTLSEADAKTIRLIAQLDACGSVSDLVTSWLRDELKRKEPNVRKFIAEHLKKQS